jgi:hypothetical protein
VENDLLKSPGSVYNVNGSGLQLSNTADKAVVMKGSKNEHVATSAEEGDINSNRLLQCRRQFFAALL